MFGQILVEFLFRLTLGVATAMGLTSARDVTSGFFRVHLWVLLGLQTLAALAIYSGQPTIAVSPRAELIWKGQLGLALAAAVVCYLTAVVWMYESRLAGKFGLWLLALLAALALSLPITFGRSQDVVILCADRATGSALLGFATTAMLLGHWYLNTPTMKLAPLRRLIGLLAIAVIARMAVCGAGGWLEYAAHTFSSNSARQSWLLFLALRWLAGLFGVLGLAGLTWQTLKIPNTQSATGILYAAVILALIGELMSQLLSAAAHYPI